MFLCKNEGSSPDDPTHATSTMATAAAARITSAYSAVVCPSSRRRERPPDSHATNQASNVRHPFDGNEISRTNNPNISSPPLGASGESVQAAEGCQEYRPNR